MSSGSWPAPRASRSCFFWRRAIEGVDWGLLAGRDWRIPEARRHGWEEKGRRWGRGLWWCGRREWVLSLRNWKREAFSHRKRRCCEEHCVVARRLLRRLWDIGVVIGRGLHLIDRPNFWIEDAEMHRKRQEQMRKVRRHPTTCLSCQHVACSLH